MYKLTGLLNYTKLGQKRDTGNLTVSVCWWGWTSAELQREWCKRRRRKVWLLLCGRGSRPSCLEGIHVSAAQWVDGGWSACCNLPGVPTLHWFWVGGVLKLIINRIRTRCQAGESCRLDRDVEEERAEECILVKRAERNLFNVKVPGHVALLCLSPHSCHSARESQLRYSVHEREFQSAATGSGLLSRGGGGSGSERRSHPQLVGRLPSRGRLSRWSLCPMRRGSNNLKTSCLNLPAQPSRNVLQNDIACL